jgi:hypothetical protein
MQKICKYCNNEKSLNQFTTCKLCKDGYSHMCKDCYKQKYYADNIESHKKKYKENREEKLLYQKEYVISNRHVKRAADAKRRASKLSATPKWLSSSELFAIKQFYKLAKLLESLTAIKYHIDHIVPLQGENVCGLHVPWNLQIITAEENLSKSNSFNS